MACSLRSRLVSMAILLGVQLWPGAAAALSPSALQPRATNTGHELGVGTHLGLLHTTTFLPRVRYRYQFARTSALGPLGGLWLEAAIGPALYGDPDGNAAFNLGYELDPFDRVAITFSPVLRNDALFDVDWILFSQTYGASVRMYIQSHWVVFVNPFAFGWYTHNYRNGVGFAFQTGAGFGYKF